MELCKKKSHFSTQNECQQIKEKGISRVLSDHNGMKLEIKSKRNYRKYMNSRQMKKTHDWELEWVVRDNPEGKE